MRTHVATRLLALILSLRCVARIQTSLNSCDRSQQQNSVAATMIFPCHTRRFVAATCRGDVSQRFVASCVSALMVTILSSYLLRWRNSIKRHNARSSKHDVGASIKATLDDAPSSVLRNPKEDSFLAGANVEGLYSVCLVYVGSLVPSVSAIIEEPIKNSGSKLNVSFHSVR